jgi:hypothetical protein
MAHHHHNRSAYVTCEVHDEATCDHEHEDCAALDDCCLKHNHIKDGDCLLDNIFVKTEDKKSALLPTPDFDTAYIVVFDCNTFVFNYINDSVFKGWQYILPDYSDFIAQSNGLRAPPCA